MKLKKMSAIFSAVACCAAFAAPAGASASTHTVQGNFVGNGPVTYSGIGSNECDTVIETFVTNSGEKINLIGASFHYAQAKKPPTWLHPNGTPAKSVTWGTPAKSAQNMATKPGVEVPPPADWPFAPTKGPWYGPSKKSPEEQVTYKDSYTLTKDLPCIGKAGLLSNAPYLKDFKNLVTKAKIVGKLNPNNPGGYFFTG